MPRILAGVYFLLKMTFFKALGKIRDFVKVNY